jgi:outer membrane protein OmpA-like peptidoglycan-associated protein
MKRQSCFLLVGLIFFLFSACAATQPEPVATGNPGEMVGQLEADLDAARANQVDVLAPSLFDEAETTFMKAKEALEEGAKLSTISEYVAESNARLKAAEEIAQVSRTVLAETNKARDKALKAGADQLGEPYIEVEEQYLKLTKAIENDNLSYAQKNAAKVQAAYRKVEIMAIKERAIGEARRMITEAEAADVPEIAPKAYGEAQQALKEADAYISDTPYDTGAIRQKAAHAEFMARRMMVISQSSLMFAEKTPEASALYVEELLASLSNTMNADDLRDQRFDAQVSALNTLIEAMKTRNHYLEKSNQAYQTQLSGLESYAREQESAKEKLAAERAFNEQFDRVQQYFRPDEAEVYKQGNQLVIRMRGIKFPVGESTLSPDNYTLLSKVQQAIGVFGQPIVTVEGHTDSTGSAQTNQELSQKRAEAVKTYLVANRTLPENRIRAIGYGPDRPLAPNTTAEGRATNRRIDVVITPTQKQ